MAKRRSSGGSSSIVARAEGWYGVSHNVPRRGTAAHRAMVSKYMRSHPGVQAARHNPTEMYRIDTRGDDRVWMHGRKKYSSLRAAIKAASSKLRAVGDSLFDIEVINDDTEKTVWTGDDYHRARGKGQYPRHNPTARKARGSKKRPYPKATPNMAKALGIPVGSYYMGKMHGRTTYNYSGKITDTVMFGKPRHNPITTQRERRVLHPENCSAETTQRLLAKRKAEGRAGVKHKTSRIGNCDYRSASYALAHHTGGGGGSLASRILPWWPSSK